MGNLVRLVLIICNSLIFYSVNIEEKTDNLIACLLLFNALCFVCIYFFDFISLSKKKLNKFILLERTIKEFPFRDKMYAEIKFSLIKNKLNWFVLSFPSVLVFLVENHDYEIVDVIFAAVIFLNLVMNIGILSILIRNYYKRFYILYLILIGLIFQMENLLFSFNKTNLFWFSVSLIIVTYFSIIILSIKVKKVGKKNNGLSFLK